MRSSRGARLGRCRSDAPHILTTVSTGGLDRQPLGRSLCTAGLVAMAMAVVVASLMAAIPPAGLIDFTVLRGGDPIGRHSVTFERRGEDLYVNVDIDIEVRFAFFTLFRYRHENREVWRDGRLVSLDAWTDDDGTRYEVAASATPEGVRIEGTSGTFLAPAEIIPTSYWNPQTIDQTQLLDTQSGRLLDVTIDPLGEDTVAVGSVEILVRKYAALGDLNLEVWYTPRGEWAKIAFEARGTMIDYVPTDAWARQLGESE